MKKEDLIQKYNKGTLSPKEDQELKQLLDTDAEFKILFEEFNSMNKVINSYEKDQLKAQLIQLEHKSKPKVIVKWLIAASVIILLGIGSFNYLTEKQDTTATLYATYFDAYPNILAPAIRGEEDLNALSLAMVAYENNNYNKALNVLQKISKTNNDEGIRFYIAMCLLKTNKEAEALEALNSLKAPTFKQQVLWYKALIYLKQNRIKDSKDKLEEALNITNFFKRKEAEELLKVLD